MMDSSLKLHLHLVLTDPPLKVLHLDFHERRQAIPFSRKRYKSWTTTLTVAPKLPFTQPSNGESKCDKNPQAEEGQRPRHHGSQGHQGQHTAGTSDQARTTVAERTNQVSLEDEGQ